MKLAKTTVAAGLLVLAMVMAGCSSSSSSSSPAASSSTAATQGAAAAPTDASQSDFCKTFTQLGKGITPRQASDRLIAVGTPSGIDDSARKGFEVLVDHLGALPDDSKRADLESMARDLPATDESNVVAFVTYVGSACQTVPGR
jgi:ABC-type Fe3+-hydroxamate transport system substrate-binding protein